MDYSAYLIKADQHIRMAYHYAELKDFKKSMDELLFAIVELKLAVTAIKDAETRRQEQWKVPPAS